MTTNMTVLFTAFHF